MRSFGTPVLESIHMSKESIWKGFLGVSKEYQYYLFNFLGVSKEEKVDLFYVYDTLGVWALSEFHFQRFMNDFAGFIHKRKSLIKWLYWLLNNFLYLLGIVAEL